MGIRGSVNQSRLENLLQFSTGLVLHVRWKRTLLQYAVFDILYSGSWLVVWVWPLAAARPHFFSHCCRQISHLGGSSLRRLRQRGGHRCRRASKAAMNRMWIWMKAGKT